MRLRIASIDDLPIKESERKYYWPLGRRPDDHPSLSDLGLWAESGKPFLEVELTTAMVFPSEEIRDQALKSGMTDGTAASYDLSLLKNVIWRGFGRQMITVIHGPVSTSGAPATDTK